MLEIYKKVLTDFGSQCQAQALSGKKITFTVFQLGDGEYTGEETTETLMQMNALKSQKQEFGISKMELSEGSDTIILTLIAINSEVNIGYNIREIGIFAKDANGTQGLYSICVAKKDKPDWMPAYNGIDPVTLVYRDYLRVGNVENISVALNNGGLATTGMLEETATELRNEIETLEFEDYTDEEATVPGAREAIAAIVSGIKRPVLFSKIKAALMGLVTLGEMRALLVNNGLCTESGKFFMDAAFGKTLLDQITKLNGDLAATAKSYTPVFTWSNSGTSPTVKNIQVRYSVMAKICFIYARYEITSLGNPGDNDYLKVSLPEGIIPVFEPLSMISEYQTNSELPKVLGVRTMPDGYLHVVEGVGGGYSGSYIPTGYQGFSAFFMFK